MAAPKAAPNSPDIVLAANVVRSGSMGINITIQVKQNPIPDHKSGNRCLMCLLILARFLILNPILLFPMELLESLKYRHPEHRKYADYWQTLSYVVDGGDLMTVEEKLALLPNPDGRPLEVMEERAKLASYCNKIAPILSRFNSELFRCPGVPVGSENPFWADEFFPCAGLIDDDDDARSSFSTILRESMMMALTTGKAIAQVDVKAGNNSLSLADQKASGELNPYVVLHHRTALWDWACGLSGFTFTKIHQFRISRDTWYSDPIPEHIFTIYYRQGEKIYTSKYIVRKIPRGKPVSPMPFIEGCDRKDVTIDAVLEDQEIFNMGGRFEFPIITLTLPRSLWMASQLFDCQRSYFNQTAALEYALYTNNYSIPIITGVDDESDDPLRGKRVGDGYYLTLKTGQAITNFERSTSTVDNAIKYRSEIKRDIYDILQQIAMSASDGAAIIARSGESKKEDRRPEEILLERYGQIIKEYIIQILNCAAIAHREVIQWDVVGYDDFLGFSMAELLTDMVGIESANIPSPTFNKEVIKHFIKRAGRIYDLDEEAITTALAEVDTVDLTPPPAPVSDDKNEEDDDDDSIEDNDNEEDKEDE